MPHFLCRLSAPRPSFPGDMTPAEAALMGEHAGYWTSLVERGVAVVFGPVADPGGVWGLGIVEAGDAMAVERLLAADPVTRGRGFCWTVTPMLQAVARGSSADADRSAMVHEAMPESATR